MLIALLLMPGSSAAADGEGSTETMAPAMDLVRDAETIAADHELELYLGQEEALLADEQHMAAKATASNGIHMPGFEGVVELMKMDDMKAAGTITTSGKPPSPPTARARQRTRTA